jgi:hypothetical protein
MNFKERDIFKYQKWHRCKTLIASKSGLHLNRRNWKNWTWPPMISDFVHIGVYLRIVVIWLKDWKDAPRDCGETWPVSASRVAIISCLRQKYIHFRLHITSTSNDSPKLYYYQNKSMVYPWETPHFIRLYALHSFSHTQERMCNLSLPMVVFRTSPPPLMEWGDLHGGACRS